MSKGLPILSCLCGEGGIRTLGPDLSGHTLSPAQSGRGEIRPAHGGG